MIDNKEFLRGFLQYLQSYYGQASMFETNGIAPTYPNQPRLSLFQEGQVPNTDQFPGMMDQGMVQQPMGGMNQLPALPGETLGQELNGMFAGPYDPMRTQ